MVARPALRSGFRGFDSRARQNGSFIEIGHEIVSTTIFSLPLNALIKVWQLLVMVW